MDSQRLYSRIGHITRLYDFVILVIGYKKSVEYFVSQLPFSEDDQIKILDAGCGTGLYSLALLQKYKNANVIAFDLNEKLVARFKEKVLKNKLDNRVHLFTADIRGSLQEIENKKFNLIVTAGVLEYVPLEETVRNLSRFLIPGGYFFNSPVRDTIWGRIICKLFACKPHGDRNIQVFEENGFKLEKAIEVPKNPSASFKDAHIFKKSY